MDVAVMARGEGSLEGAAKDVAALGRRVAAIRVDVAELASVEAAFARAKSELGAIDVLVYNAGAFRMGSVLDLPPDEFETCLRVNCTGGFFAARQVLPDMVARGSGTVLFTGATAALRGSANFACLAVGKFGLRALAQSMARELQPKGIHVAHVVIDGQIDTPRMRQLRPGRDAAEMLAPDAIAEQYWQLHVQDRTCWTHELDMRPSVEKF
jgi:NAD(P)-dependent dehydrogenase (short-subunit alcohol dehydrogenase family)